MKKDNPYHDESLFKGAPKSAFLKARLLRNKMTPSEKILWGYLQNKKFEGFKFRRQHPIHLFIVDYYYHELGLIIEIDGAYHETKEQEDLDEKRTELLKFQGLTVIRCTNEEVLTDIDTVLTKIKETIDKINSSRRKGI
ncbi:endonuclease domain-containing protein [Gelidibacter mesophilus]|uniref:endonuclease domain-containing protein n=1 Tax=Gelidibacter mesophilus TaxID=169050 RepID=UPI00041A4625|nr:endonuclease domain-containing protein [Gelidibacter mesophilus]